MNIYSIYKIVNNINGKVYIGFDSKWPSRIAAHFYKANSKKSTHFYLHQAINKYGKENFSYELLYQSLEKEHTLKIMEPFFIKEYKSFDLGYNQTIGGEGSFGKKQSLENKQKQSKKRKELNQKSKWYNNGKENRFCEKHPGKNWAFGRLNQKPTTTGCKWYNNGVQQILTKKPPMNWVLGMLPRNNLL